MRGAATAEELAAVVAVLAGPSRGEPVPNGYEQWRAVRRRALHRPAATDHRPI